MAEIVLATINARHTHSSLGLRWLQANLGPWRDRSVLMEFVSGSINETLAERILAHHPRIVGFGVYIWNVVQTGQLMAILRQLAPDIRLVIGGPEVSHELDDQSIVAMADHIVTGPGERAFAALCERLLTGHAEEHPEAHRIAGEIDDLDALVLPYDLYSDDDIAHRTLYVEASRGCPYRCEFCLSALDRSAKGFDVDRVLESLARLRHRGARRFKFVDRTFNLKASTSQRLLDFFLEHQRAHPNDPLFAHFEFIPDHLPEGVAERIAEFAPGTLQLEIGIQTWNPDVQARISRRQNNERAADNLRWLRQHTHAHLHVDLIVGLPGETIESFAEGFDRLHALQPHEIQVGILKRLRGAPIARHTPAWAMRYNPNPPYNVLSTSTMNFPTIQRLTRFSRYWDLYANSGWFTHTLPWLLGSTPLAPTEPPPRGAFTRFLAFSDWLYAHTDATHRLSPERRFDLLQAYSNEFDPVNRAGWTDALAADRRSAGRRSGRGPGAPSDTTAVQRPTAEVGVHGARHAPENPRSTPPRQTRWLRQTG